MDGNDFKLGQNYKKMILTFCEGRGGKRGKSEQVDGENEFSLRYTEFTDH